MVCMCGERLGRRLKPCECWLCAVYVHVSALSIHYVNKLAIKCPIHTTYMYNCTIPCYIMIWNSTVYTHLHTHFLQHLIHTSLHSPGVSAMTISSTLLYRWMGVALIQPNLLGFKNNFEAIWCVVYLDECFVTCNEMPCDVYKYIMYMNEDRFAGSKFIIYLFLSYSWVWSSQHHCRSFPQIRIWC